MSSCFVRLCVSGGAFRSFWPGSATMALKGFSYAMIGAFVCGLAMTVAGSAGVLLGL